MTPFNQLLLPFKALLVSQKNLKQDEALFIEVQNTTR